MADSKVGRTRRVRTASTTSSGHESDIVRRSFRGVPARTLDGACRRPRSGLMPYPRLGPSAGADTNLAIAAGQCSGLCGAQCTDRSGTRLPNVHEIIRQQCEAFLRDFSDSREFANLRTPAMQGSRVAGGDTASSYAFLDASSMARPAEPKSETTRTAVRRLVLAPGFRAEAASMPLQAFCGFLHSLIEVHPNFQPAFVHAFCQSGAREAVQAIEFARDHFDRLQEIPEVASHAGGDVVYLLLGCLAGKGIDEIWNRETMQALPIAHLAFFNALASAAAKRPAVVKRVA